MEQRPILSKNEKLAMNIGGETTSRVMTLDGKTAEDVIKERNINKFNEQVDAYTERLNEHSAKLDEYAETVAKNIETIEIMPIGNYILGRLFEDNPFQRIVKEGSIITDLGGLHPQYKNTDNGQIEEEEQIIKVMVVMEVGPECKYVKPNDVIMTTGPSLVPVPFYKQNLQIVNENRVVVVINEGLTKRFNEIKKK